ncbi:MAG: M48 family metalloprotease [Chlamydiae bacterium]|nr:M48 family metalloprotease [Chlamydiota bacterium]
MAWNPNLLAYAIPLWGICDLLSVFNPRTYRQYESAQESSHASDIKKIIQRVLTAENQPGMAYYETIQEMIKDLPDSVGIKNIEAFISHRIKVVSMKNTTSILHVAGTDIDFGPFVGKIFIGVHSNLKEQADALPWVTMHEIRHILEGDGIDICGYKMIASLFATVLSTFLLRWTLLPSISAALLARIVTHIILSRRIESRADDFANKYSTVDEKEKAIAAMKLSKNFRPLGLGLKQGVFYIFNKIVLQVTHPSIDSRIAKIQVSLAPTEKQKTA